MGLRASIGWVLIPVFFVLTPIRLPAQQLDLGDWFKKAADFENETNTYLVEKKRQETIRAAQGATVHLCLDVKVESYRPLSLEPRVFTLESSIQNDLTSTRIHIRATFDGVRFSDITSGDRVCGNLKIDRVAYSPGGCRPEMYRLDPKLWWWEGSFRPTDYTPAPRATIEELRSFGLWTIDGILEWANRPTKTRDIMKENAELFSRFVRTEKPAIRLRLREITMQADGNRTTIRACNYRELKPLPPGLIYSSIDVCVRNVIGYASGDWLAVELGRFGIPLESSDQRERNPTHDRFLEFEGRLTSIGLGLYRDGVREGSVTFEVTRLLSSSPQLP
jgi:hypothetical protein